MAINVTALYRYPIKSCRGMSLDEALIGLRGITLDREFVIVDERGLFVSQRSGKRGNIGVRSMCLVVPELRGDEMVIRAPGMPDMQFCLYEPYGEFLQVRVWDTVCEAQEADPRVSEWFTEYICREHAGRYRFVQMLGDFQRRASTGNSELTFADGFPFLITSHESLDELNRRMGEPHISMDRFRPNIVISGCQIPHAEDTMDRIKIGGVEFAGQTLCDRCPMPGIDQTTASKDGRPLVALAGYRRMKTGSDKVQFGRNFNHLNLGRIRVGDKVEVLAWSA